MRKTKKEQGWQNVPKEGAYTLQTSTVVADKPKSLKRRESEENKEKRIPFPAGYNGGNPRRINDGGLIRLKRRNEK